LNTPRRLLQRIDECLIRFRREFCKPLMAMIRCGACATIGRSCCATLLNSHNWPQGARREDEPMIVARRFALGVREAPDTFACAQPGFREIQSL
jgi:hypothetical protein